MGCVTHPERRIRSARTPVKPVFAKVTVFTNTGTIFLMSFPYLQIQERFYDVVPVFANTGTILGRHSRNCKYGNDVKKIVPVFVNTVRVQTCSLPYLQKSLTGSFRARKGYF